MIKQISVGLMVSLSTMAYADDHATTTPGPVETWDCILNEGRLWTTSARSRRWYPK